MMFICKPGKYESLVSFDFSQDQSGMIESFAVFVLAYLLPLYYNK
jgi:hypothetical protein